jgi:pimeloyl-ACP methyl ester carboxylesterase
MHGTPGSRMLRDPSDTYEKYRLMVCTYDRPGYGLSTRRRGYTQAQTVDDVVAIADELGWERFAVAGASGGSGATLASARLLPDRVIRCAVVVGGGPSTAPEIQAAMDDEYRRKWERGARADEEGLAEDFDEFLEWFEAGMPDLDFDDVAERSMLAEVIVEARRQGAAGYIDDCIADASDWGFAVEDIRVPTRVMGAREDTAVMQEHSRILAAQIPGAQLLWRAGGHMAASDEEARLLAWVGHGVDPAPS